MSEKRLRFTMESDKLYSCIFDNGNELTCFELVDLLNEQQATIRKLQDLCGESDYENAKLRIENKKLREENEQLKRDEQLYAKEILRLKQELKEAQMLKLGGDY